MKAKLLRKIRKYYSWKFTSNGSVIILNDYLKQFCNNSQNIRSAVEYLTNRIMDSNSLVSKNYQKYNEIKSRNLYKQHKNNL